MARHRYVLILSALFALWWVLLAIAPWDRQAWLLQNIGVLGGVLALAVSRRRFWFSRVSYTLMFLLFCLLALGAHYTYPDTPYDQWFEALTGHSLNASFGWERNNFDRIAHFAYGFLLAYPLRELLLRVADVRGLWGYLLPVDVVMSTSLVFELVEWMTAELFGGGRQAFVGTQGDVWDAQKDMAVASLGALLAMSIVAAVNWHYQRDFAREWTESLRVKCKEATNPDGLAWFAHKKK